MAYSTTERYQQEVASATRGPTRISGVINLLATDKDPAVNIGLDTNDIMEGSLTIDNSAVDGNTLGFGSVYTGRCTLSIKIEGKAYTLTKDYRERLYGSRITLIYYQSYTEAVTSQNIRLGYWYITDVKKIGDKYINISAYDVMTKFDKDIPATANLNGTPYTLIYNICNSCGVSRAQTQTQIDELSPKSLYAADTIVKFQRTKGDDKIKTYRQLLSQIATVMGGFFTINRNGYLEFRTFGAQYPVTIADTMWKNLTMADFKQYQQKVTADFNGSTTSSTSRTIVGIQAKPRTLDAGSIYLKAYTDLVQNESSSVVESMKDQGTKDGLISVPADIEWGLGDPAIDLGDMIKITGPGIESNTYIIVTSQSWTYHGGHKLHSIGLDQDSLAGATQAQQAKTAQTVQQVVRTDVEPKIPKILTGKNTNSITFDGTYQDIITINGLPTTGTLILSGQVTVFYSGASGGSCTIYRTLSGGARQVLAYHRSNTIGYLTATFNYPLTAGTTTDSITLCVLSSSQGSISSSNAFLIVTCYP